MNLDDMFATNSSTDAIDNKLDVQRKIDKLGHLDRAILYLWCSGFSQTELGVMFGYSDRHIRRILANINEKCPKHDS